MWESLAFVFTSRINDIQAWNNVYTSKLIPLRIGRRFFFTWRDSTELSSKLWMDDRHKIVTSDDLEHFMYCCCCRFSHLFFFEETQSSIESESISSRKKKKPMPNVISGRQSETPMLEKSEMSLTIIDNWWQYDDYLRLLMIYCHTNALESPISLSREIES